MPPLYGYEGMDKIRMAIQSNLPPEKLHLLNDMKAALSAETKKRIEQSNFTLKTIADIIQMSEGKEDIDGFINKQIDNWNMIVALERKNGKLS